ncbi:MAG: DUF1302 domain-containing protein [Halioglobus sp.]
MIRRLGMVALALLPLNSWALDFEFGNGVELSLDSTVTWGAQWRVEERDGDLTGRQFLADLEEDPFLPLTNPEYSEAQTVILNGNDGNNNFDTGLISNRLTLLVDMDMRWQHLGMFLRGRAFYDHVYSSNDTDLDSIDYATYNSGAIYGGDAAPGEFPAQTENAHGDTVEILDAFLYGTWELPGDRLMDLRFGRQVINWGESTFYQGVNSLQNRVDAQAANVPGVEVKEIFLPTGAFYLQVDVLTDLTLEAYYQFEWLENDLNGVGSYFSYTDQVGPGANAFLIPTPNSPLVPENIRGNEFQLRGVPRSADDNADDAGQYGLALHYVTSNNWDIGLYHVNAHDKKPSFVLDYIEVPGSPQPVPVSYLLRYYENIKGTAASFTTVIGSTNVQGELSFLDGTPMVNAAGDPEREDLLKAQIGGSHVFGPSFLADDTVLTFEAFYADVSSADADELREDDYAWGYSMLADFFYNNLFQGWDFKVPVYFKHDVSGTLRELQVFEEARVLSIGVQGIYLNNLTTGLAYSFYSGGGQTHLLRDRDNIALTVKYSF